MSLSRYEEERQQEIRRLTEEVEKNPSSAPAHFALGRALFYVGNAHGRQKSPQHLEQAIALDPQMAEAYAQLGHWYQFGGADWDKARDLYQQAARLFRQRGAEVNARQCDRDAAQLVFEMGMEHLWQGNSERAESLYRQALTIAPRHVDALVHIANLRSEEGQLSQAQRLYEQALAAGEEDLDVAHTATERAWWGQIETRPYMRALHGLAWVHYRGGRYPQALALYERMLALNPNDNQGVRFLIGELHHRLGHLEEAVKTYQRYPEHPDVKYNAALAHYQSGNRQQSVVWLRQAFFDNLYVPLLLLGKRCVKHPIWHGTNRAEPEWARDYWERCGDLWRQTAGALPFLQAVWGDPQVREDVAEFVRLGKSLKGLEPSRERNRTLRARDRLTEAKRLERTSKAIVARLQPSGATHLSRPRTRGQKTMAGSTPRADVYQLKVTLSGIRPLIWRRFQVKGETTLHQLHRILQVVMGWEDYHLHQFVIAGVTYGGSDEAYGGERKSEKTVTLREAAPQVGTQFFYEYDFGDRWEHELVVEKVVAAQAGVHYPRCLSGRRACPPEDSGGLWGYAEVLKALRHPRRPEHRETLAWLGKRFRPDAFDLEGINQELQRLP